MADAAQAGEQEQSFRVRVTRTLRSRRAAWWYRLLARTGAAQFVSYMVAGFMITGIQTIRHIHPFYQVPDVEFALALGLSPLGALLVAVYSYRTMEDPKPPETRLSRREWRNYAQRKALAVAVGVGWVMSWLSFLLIAGGVALLVNLPELPLPLAAAVGVLLVGVLLLGLLAPPLLASYAYDARRDQEFDILEAETTPELRVAMDLNARAETYRYRAEALEDAMEEATGISDQLRREIQLQQQQLRQLQEDYLRRIELSKLTPEQAAAVAELLSRQQEHGARRALWSNIAIAFVFYLAGVVTPAFVSSDALGEQLQRWFHLG